MPEVSLLRLIEAMHLHRLSYGFINPVNKTTYIELKSEMMNTPLL